ncbi:hypothetical protein BDW66DRAFT_130309 [Aspergillus desertorum]
MICRLVTFLPNLLHIISAIESPGSVGFLSDESRYERFGKHTQFSIEGDEVSTRPGSCVILVWKPSVCQIRPRRVRKLRRRSWHINMTPVTPLHAPRVKRVALKDQSRVILRWTLPTNAKRGSGCVTAIGLSTLCVGRLLTV